MEFFLDSALLGLEYAFLALGVFITFRILNIPDLTADGSFTLGVAVSAVCAAAGYPFLGLFLAVLAGAAAGCVTGFLQTKAGIHPILAGILTMSGLYTVNLTIMGGPNVSLIDSPKAYEYIVKAGLPKGSAKLLFILLLLAAVIGMLALFFKTVFGLCIRATGDNENMVKASSINTVVTKVFAIALANGLVALSGAVVTQYQAFGDVNSGSGMIVIGLASVIIGEAIFGRRSLTVGLLSAALGSVGYRILIAIALKANILSANSLKLISAVIVAVTLSIPAIRGEIVQRKSRKGASKC